MSNVNNSKKYTPPYKSLVILITQNGTEDPSLIAELENTIGSYIFDYISIGKYQISFDSDVLTSNKTTCDISNNINLPFDGAPLVYTSINQTTLNKLEINTGGAWNDVVNNQISVVPLDGLLNTPTKIEIRVYN